MKHNVNVNDTHRERRAFENHPHKLSSHSLRVYNITVCLQGFCFINTWCTVHGTFTLFFFYWKEWLTQHWCFIHVFLRILWLDSVETISRVWPAWKNDCISWTTMFLGKEHTSFLLRPNVKKKTNLIWNGRIHVSMPSSAGRQVQNRCHHVPHIFPWISVVMATFRDYVIFF